VPRLRKAPKDKEMGRIAQWCGWKKWANSREGLGTGRLLPACGGGGRWEEAHVGEALLDRDGKDSCVTCTHFMRQANSSVQLISPLVSAGSPTVSSKCSEALPLPRTTAPGLRVASKTTPHLPYPIGYWSLGPQGCFSMDLAGAVSAVRMEPHLTPIGQRW
jgi:hypothetical protein